MDKRTHEGRDALRLQAGLVEDAGGIEAITTARFIAIRELTQLCYLGSLMDKGISSWLHKNPQYTRNPRVLAKLFGYRAPVNSAIAKYLDVLGLQKLPPPQKTLEEILSEDAESDEGVTGSGERSHGNGNVTSDESSNGNEGEQ